MRFTSWRSTEIFPLKADRKDFVGSHQWGLAGDAYTFGEKDLEGLRARFATEDRPWIDEPCNLRAGEASFHHALTFHGSGPNFPTLWPPAR